MTHPESIIHTWTNLRFVSRPLGLTLSLLLGLAACAAPSKPNVVVIMADDLGYGDVGCYGAKPKNLKTPHIDRLAKEGLKFTSGYCSASTCTPRDIPS